MQNCRTYGSVETAAAFVSKYMPADDAIALVRQAVAEGSAKNAALGVHVWRWDDTRVRVVTTPDAVEVADDEPSTFAATIPGEPSDLYPDGDDDLDVAADVLDDTAPVSVVGEHYVLDQHDPAVCGCGFHQGGPGDVGMMLDDDAYDAWCEQQEARGDLAGVPEQMLCHECGGYDGVLRDVVALGAVTNRADPTQTYVLSCTHVTI